jgi:hypothetical protein
MKKWAIPIGLEAAGTAVFLSGLLYYIFFVMLPEPRPEITKELLEKYLFQKEISTKVMTAGGIFLFIGLITMLAIILTALITKKELSGPVFKSLHTKLNSRVFIFVKYLMLIVPFCVPVLFNFFYQPINRNITVKHFGCGCPNIDGSYGFDSNDFNMILWMPVLFTSILLWTFLAKQFFKKKTKVWAILGGIYILTLMSLRFYGRSIWF